MFDSRAELLAVYRSTPVTLRALVAGAGESLIKRRPADDDWSIIEIVCHLVDVEERTVKRIERMLTEDNPALPGFDQDELVEARNYRSRDIEEELSLFASARQAHVARLKGLDDAGWRRTGQHEEVGVITVEALTAHMAAHDAIHLAQIASIVTAG